VDSRRLQQLTLFTLTDKAEQDHCANIYHKSLLYLVSHAFEARMRNPLVPVNVNPAAAGEPLLGMEWWLSRDRALSARFKVPAVGVTDPVREGPLVWIKSPNTFPEGSRYASAARAHGALTTTSPPSRQRSRGSWSGPGCPRESGSGSSARMRPTETGVKKSCGARCRARVTCLRGWISAGISRPR
jgi:hypothetical protein